MNISTPAVKTAAITALYAVGFIGLTLGTWLLASLVLY